jgi:hypothetical protein
VRKALLCDIYMIGRTKEQARPTIIFSCENKIQRQRAQKIVRRSGILDQYPGFCLGESTRPLRLTMSPQPLFGNKSEDASECEDVGPSISETLVLYSSPVKNIYGIPIMIQSPDMHKATTSRKATAGGVISIHGKFFALTVAHVFSGSLIEESLYIDDGNLELSIEDEDEDDEDMWDFQDDEYLVSITSRGERMSIGGNLVSMSHLIQEANLPNNILVRIPNPHKPSTRYRLTLSRQEYHTVHRALPKLHAKKTTP